MSRPPSMSGDPARFRPRLVFTTALLLMLCLLPMYASATPPVQTLKQMYHTAWTAREGGPGEIDDIAQTSDGYLWFGTGSGLFRFDGVRFERFIPVEGSDAPNVGVYSMLADKQGGLWVGWHAQDISYLKDGKFTTYSVKDGLPAATVTGLHQDGNGRIWAATSVGLYLREGSRWRAIFSTMGYTGGTLNVLSVDREGTLWVSDLTSVFALGKDEDKFHFVVNHPKIFQMQQDNFGREWGLDRTGSLVSLSGSDPEHPVWHLPTTAKTTGLLFTRDGTAWIGTAGNGMLRTAVPRPGDASSTFNLERL